MGAILDIKAETIIHQLKDQIERLKTKHKTELDDKNKEIKALKDQLKVKKRTEDVIEAEYTFQYFPAIILSITKVLDPTDFLSKFYIKYVKLLNYCLVCGLGVVINQFVIHFFIKYLPLFWSNNFAIATAFLWNYTLSVGPLGFLFGLAPKKKKVKMDDT